MKAPIGAVVKLYVDARWPLEPHHILTTPTGRAYVILTVRVQMRGKHRGRQHLQALVAELASLPPDAPRFLLRWYKRGP